MFKWIGVEKKEFDEIKCIMARNTLLSHTYFKKRFDIHTDASDKRLGAVIRQVTKPIALYTRKIMETKKRYTVREK